MSAPMWDSVDYFYLGAAGAIGGILFALGFIAGWLLCAYHII